MRFFFPALSPDANNVVCVCVLFYTSKHTSDVCGFAQYNMFVTARLVRVKEDDFI